MEAFVAAVIGIMTASGVYLVLRNHTFAVVLGVSMLGYAVNAFLFASGGLTLDSAPLISSDMSHYPDPLPQALVLTAIVIGFAMIAFLIVLALKALQQLGGDGVDDGEES
jgi:multicomponent K+:H+ antiporter subunit C